MGSAAVTTYELDDSFARSLPEMHRPWAPVPVADPSELVVNEALAADLGIDAAWLHSPDGVALLSGNDTPDDVVTVAQAYAGHQFGGYSPSLGDGRAVLLGEFVQADGTRRDLHLKGSGRTPFARGGDGRAAVGPMLREYLIGEAMHALGIPTTRALAVVATGESIVREVRGRAVQVPGAVLARVAASHLRIGSFQYAAATGDRELLHRLVLYAIARHAPDAAGAPNPTLALYDHVIDAQARLVAQWMHVGFIHGVMNTDNMTISGETIDYGPCAFMNAYDPATVYSSIDHAGRYAFGNQPAIATWNLARLGEALLPLLDDDADAAVETATASLQRFPERFQDLWITGMRRKLGLDPHDDSSDGLVGELLDLMAEHRVDTTSFLRSLSTTARGDADATRRHFTDPTAFDAWADSWRPRVVADGPATMDRVNPVYIPRNHLVEEALDAATGGDLTAFHMLSSVLASPFDDQPGRERYAEPGSGELDAGYQTFCGT